MDFSLEGACVKAYRIRDLASGNRKGEKIDCVRVTGTRVPDLVASADHSLIIFPADVFLILQRIGLSAHPEVIPAKAGKALLLSREDGHNGHPVYVFREEMRSSRLQENVVEVPVFFRLVVDNL